MVECAFPVQRRVRSVTSLAHSRSRIAVVGIVVTGLGAGSRLWPLGLAVWDDHLGDACYAAMICVVLAVALPAWTRTRRALLALSIGASIEAFQATGYPAEWARSFRPLALVFGTTFAWQDLVAQAVGVALAAAALPGRSVSAR